MEECDAAGRRGGSTQRLQPVLTDCGRKPDENRVARPGQLAGQVTQERGREVEVERVRAQPTTVEHDLAAPVRVEMQTRVRGTYGDRCAHTEEAAVTLGAGYQHGAAQGQGG